jgi:hypothetical protein
MATEDRGSKALQRIEIAATVLLALATVATAWSGYQATRWAGETTKASGAANGARVLAARSDGLANAQTQVDVATFIQWVDAYARNEPQLLDFYYERFREEFKPAADAWIATMPLENPDAPLTPFAMPEYVLAAREEAERQDVIAAEKVSEVNRNVQRQSNYVFCVVLFATALFFAGMTTRLSSRGPRLAALTIGCIVFAGTVAWLFTFPVSVTV